MRSTRGRRRKSHPWKVLGSVPIPGGARERAMSFGSIAHAPGMIVALQLDLLRVFHLPPRRESNNWRTLSKAGMPPFFTYLRGDSPPNIGFVFGNVIQASASLWP